MRLVFWFFLWGCAWDELSLRDVDGDGYTLATGDCAEGIAEVNPGVSERWYNGIDEDCDGLDGDQDGDGFVPDAYAQAFPSWRSVPGQSNLEPGDCWDDPADTSPLDQALGDPQLQPQDVNPAAIERWYDAVDQDCDGGSDFDQDGDGFDSASAPQPDGSVGDDCADGSEDDTVFHDLCGDGEPIPLEDPAQVFPGAQDLWYDGIDQDCDGADDYDQDGDGFRSCEECDDLDPEVYPSDRPEVWYNCVDEDCDGRDGDKDGDGYLAEDYPERCEEWRTLNPGLGTGDCWDDPEAPPESLQPLNGLTAPEAEQVHPDAEDTPYDGIDGDCAGDVYEFDADQDGFESSSHLDERGAAAGTDCDDSAPSVNPEGQEDCFTEADDDCDGQTNQIDALNCTAYYQDKDDDGFGSDLQRCLCGAMDSDSYTAGIDLDCDDEDSEKNPLASEICDSSNSDEDCDGLADDLDSSVSASSLQTWYPDADADGYGDAAGSTLQACDNPGSSSAPRSLDKTDCDDSDSGVNPGATEICDSSDTDEDCDGKADDNDSSVSSSSKLRYYRDLDKDSYGGSTDAGSSRCDSSSTYTVTNNSDCNDSNSSISPGATEICDSANTDEDCDSLADDKDSSVASTGKTTYYSDSDGDGYGSTSSKSLCDSSSPYTTTNSTDCDDTRYDVSPSDVEICDSANTDEDCDGLADDKDSSARVGTKSSWYTDVDGDTYGDENISATSLCDASGNIRALVATDCDDSDSTINPAGKDSCWDELDQDCDAYVDEGSSTACYTGGELLISELQFYPATGSSNEWVEIYNSSSQDISLESMKFIVENTSSITTSFYIADNVVAPAGGYVVLCDSATPYSGCDYVYGSNQGFTTSLGASYNTLMNFPSSANATLSLVAMGGDFTAVTLDEVAYDGTTSGGSWPGAAQGYTYELSKLRLSATINDSGGYWCHASSSASYYTSGTKTDYGTPGVANGCVR